MSNEMKCPVPHGAGPSPNVTATETASPMHGAVTHQLAQDHAQRALVA